MDYLGGARSLSSDNTDDDVDFVNIPYNDSRLSYSKFEMAKVSSKTTATSSKQRTTVTTWPSIINKDWIDKTGYTMKFILDAIDRIPTSE